MPGSPAINAGNAAACAAAPINNLDQRGVIRPQGSVCDIGAFEYVFPQVGGAANYHFWEILRKPRGR